MATVARMGFQTTTTTTDGTRTLARTSHDENAGIVYATVEVDRPEDQFERNMVTVRLVGPWNNIDLRMLDAEGRAVAAALAEHYARLDGDVG